MLVAMEQSPSYLMLVDSEPGSVTRAESAEVLAFNDDLWPMFQLAQGALAEVERTTKNPDELARALNEVDMTVTVGGVPTPYSLTGLVADLAKRTEALQEAVEAVEARWQALLPRVTAARETLERLQAEVASLGVSEPLVSMTARKAAELAEQLVNDPLAVGIDDGVELDRLVVEAARQLANLRVSRDNLDADLNSTEELLAALRVLRERAAAAHEEALVKVADPDGLVHPPSTEFIDGEGGLADQLDQLFVDATSGRWDHKRAALDLWLDSANRAQQQLERAIERNRFPLERRASLRGRFSAYRAKMAAKGLAEDLELAALVHTINTHLYQAPSDLEAAEELLVQLAEALRR